MIRASLLSLLALGLTAAETQPAPKAAKPAAKHATKGAKAAKAETPAAPAEGADKVLARVGGETITEADFQATLKAMPQQEQMQIMMFQGGKEEFVKRLAEGKLLAVKAKHMGLDKDAEFQRALARTRDELLAREYLKREGDNLQKKLKLEENDYKAYYESHKDKYKQPETYDARHILVAFKPEGSDKARTEDETKARVAEIQAQIKAGKPLADLVDAYTDDPGSKAKKGLYTDVQKGQFVPEFEKAALALQPGQVSEPVKSQYGYHLIQLEKRVPERQKSYEESKSEVQQQALRDRQNQVWNELMDSLKKEIPVQMVAPPAPKPAAVPVPAPARKPADEPAPQGESK